MSFLILMCVIFVFNLFSNYFFVLLLFMSMGIYLMANIMLFNMMYFNMNCLMLHLDLVTFMLCQMTFILLFFIMLMNYKNKNIKMMNLIMIISYISLVLCFSMNHLFIFYIFFEISMIPLIFMIFIQGSNMERFKANMYLLIFTLSGSLLFLILMLHMNYDNLLINISKYYYFNKMNSLLWFFMLVVFLVKSPFFSLHYWLPKAHVEASISGSMLLAGILLKLGTFGLYRILYFMNSMNFKMIFNMIIYFSLMSSFLVSIICIWQTDLKMMIAYSSINHMALTISSILTLNKIGLVSSMLMMIAHGFCSSVMFFTGNMFYLQTKTRNMLILKNLTNLNPFLMNCWTIMIFMNMSIPPSMNFTSEILMIMSIMKKSILFLILIFFLINSNMIYNLFMFLNISHGMKWNMNFLKKENFLAMMIILGHLLFLLIYLLNMNNFLIYI